MEYKYFIGVDIAKHTLDFTVLQGSITLLHDTVNNNKTAIQEWLNKVMTKHKAGGKKSLFCVENTGLYTTLLQKELVRRKVPFWLESPLQINLSMGMQRGKNDKVDSLRIAQYAYTNYKKAILWQQPREVIEYLKMLRSIRERLLTVQGILKRQLTEAKGFIKLSVGQRLREHCHGSLAAIKTDLEKVNKAIIGTVTGDEHLHQLFGWLISVRGIGPVLAIEMLIATNEFKNFNSPKKFACYCGVAPFRYLSGVSLQSKGKVSRRANQRMKRLLHIAALSVIRCESDYRQYYQRKVEEGKSKMSVLNAIRNKIIFRAFACVREERCYADWKF